MDFLANTTTSITLGQAVYLSANGTVPQCWEIEAVVRCSITGIPNMRKVQLWHTGTDKTLNEIYSLAKNLILSGKWQSDFMAQQAQR